MKERKVNISKFNEEINTFEKEGKTVMMLSEGKNILGLVSVADEIREEAQQTIKKLDELGIKVYMITGDNQKTAQSIAKKVGIKNVF